MLLSSNAPTPDKSAVYDGGMLAEIQITGRAEVHPSMRDDYLLLSRLVYAEAGHEPLAGKVAVADVVLNIARFKRISIKDAIYLPGIFDGIKHPVFKMKPNRDSEEAARRAMTGRGVLPAGVLYFFNHKAASDTGWVKHISRYTYKQIGNHVFCYEPRLYKTHKKKLRKNFESD